MDTERLSRELTDQGRLIEAGFLGMRIAVINPAAPKNQIDEMRMAFFAGALHLFSSIMTIMEPGSEPTDADMARMSAINVELQKFGREFELRAAKPKGSA